MPCSDGNRGATEYNREATELKERLDERTDMLCSTLNLIETSEEPVQIGHVRGDIRAWWKKHKATDAKRIVEEIAAREKIRTEEDARQSGLAKLTPAERKALKLK